MAELLIALASITLIATSQLLFKGAMRAHRTGGRGLARAVTDPRIIGGLALNGLAALGWIVALRQLEISYLFPLLSINYLVVPLGAWWFFQETVSPRRKLAIAVICGGVALCLFSRTDPGDAAAGAEPGSPAVAKPVAVR